jgi:DNA polymerase-3 subunit epsilon
MRQVVLDTETTGLEVERGHRIIEIGCVELVSRRATGRHLHHYLNPDREIDAGAAAVHGITLSKLAGKPRFHEVADELLAFVDGAELVIHNASFDIGFLDYELQLLALRRGGVEPIRMRSRCGVLDTLALARELHPGQRCSLDALCKRYMVDNSRRELHGALLDARILGEVYLAMTGGQSVLALGEVARGALFEASVGIERTRPRQQLPVVEPTAEETAAHDRLMTAVAKASGGRALWSS